MLRRVAPPEVGEFSESEVGLVNSLTVIIYFVDSTIKRKLYIVVLSRPYASSDVSNSNEYYYYILYERNIFSR